MSHLTILLIFGAAVINLKTGVEPDLVAARFVLRSPVQRLKTRKLAINKKVFTANLLERMLP